MADKRNSITAFQQGIERAITAIRDTNNILEEVVVLGYAANMTDEDAQAIHPELVKADFVAAKNALDALNTTLNANSKAHLAAMLKLRGVAR